MMFVPLCIALPPFHGLFLGLVCLTVHFCELSHIGLHLVQRGLLLLQVLVHQLDVPEHAKVAVLYLDEAAHHLPDVVDAGDAL